MPLASSPNTAWSAAAICESSSCFRSADSRAGVGSSGNRWDVAGNVATRDWLKLLGEPLANHAADLLEPACGISPNSANSPLSRSGWHLAQCCS